MKNSLTLIFSIVIIFSSLNAQFSGYYDPSNWTETETGCVTNGWVDASGAPMSLLITGPDNPSACGSSVISLSIAAQFCGTISFDWAYTTTDCNGPYWDRFGYSINGSPVQLSTWSVQFGSPGSQSGSASFEVAGGDMIAFYMDAIDSYCGEAWVTISNFSAPDAVCFGDEGELKVQLCHNGKTICVAPAAVPAHMAHGDLLGSCFENAGCEEDPAYQVAYPTPVEADAAALAVEGDRRDLRLSHPPAATHPLPGLRAFLRRRQPQRGLRPGPGRRSFAAFGFRRASRTSGR